jgi:predicted lysophospholipase L1 biosynthesis ABC-type transport system permease subunit
MARLNQGMTLQKAETGLQPWFKAMLQENMRRADSASWLVLHDALAMILSGIGIGLPFVWALSRLVGSQLYDVKPSDPAVIAIAIVVLCSAGLGAALIPGHRASRVNPTDALRFE